MAIAKTVQWYLEANGVSYETVQHPHSNTTWPQSCRPRIGSI